MSNFEKFFTADGYTYTARLVEGKLRVFDGSDKDVTWHGAGWSPIPEDIQAGDIALHRHAERVEMVQVTRVTKTQLTAGGRRYTKRYGDEVGGERERWDHARRHILCGYDRDYFATQKARELFAKFKDDQKRSELTAEITTLCKVKSIRELERALRELK